MTKGEKQGAFGGVGGWELSNMGRGMASHTAWRARVTAKGAGQGQEGTRDQRCSPPQQSHQRIHIGYIWEMPGMAPTEKRAESPKTWQ